jgi:hypothetical protein
VYYVHDTEEAGSNVLGRVTKSRVEHVWRDGTPTACHVGVSSSWETSSEGRSGRARMPGCLTRVRQWPWLSQDKLPLPVPTAAPAPPLFPRGDDRPRSKRHGTALLPHSSSPCHVEFLRAPRARLPGRWEWGHCTRIVW